MPTDQQYEMFRAMMQTLMAKSKEELKTMMFDPKCPPLIAEIIREHPALLGESFKDLGEHPAVPDLVETTNEIIKNHGFSGRITEWEYECETTGAPRCLRIWIGKNRTKKNLRMITLTEDEASRVGAIIPAVA